MSYSPIVVTLCRGFKERSDHLGLKGAKQAAAALDYFVGAAKALEYADRHEDVQVVAAFAGFAIAFRGMAAINEVLAEGSAAAA